MENVVDLSIEYCIAIITVDNPPVNALSASVRKGLVDNMQLALSCKDVHVIIITCRGRTFGAGIDTLDFDRSSVKPLLSEVMRLIEASKKPVITALHGTVLDDGLELALASHYRIALNGTLIGLPNKKSDLIPISGGSQQFARLIDLRKCLDMFFCGRFISTDDTESEMIFHKIVIGDLLLYAKRFAMSLMKSDNSRLLRLIELGL